MRPVESAHAESQRAPTSLGGGTALPANEQRVLDDAAELLDARDVTDDEPQTLSLTDEQARKLNVLVGKLRTGKHVNTAQLWKAVGKLRNMDAPLMVELLDGRDEEGTLHWAPLRKSLSRAEASQLIDWLVIKEARVAAEAQATA